MIAITGGIASGKSTVLADLGRRGYSILDVDACVTNLWNRATFLDKLVPLVGENPTRESVRAAILASPQKRRSLNQLTHRGLMQEVLSSNADFVEVPLLVETVTMRYFEEIWVCECGELVQRQRLADRGLSQVQIDSILAIQVPEVVRSVFADELLRTNGPWINVLPLIDSALSSAGY